MARTNIDIDDELVREAMRRFGLRTKREAVDLALRRFVGRSTSADDIRSLRGIGRDGDLEAMRASKVEQ